MKKSELFTKEMMESFTCHPYAYDYCERLCEKFDGRGFQIVGHNCMTFSVQFKFENPLNGCIMFAYITRDYNHLYFV